MTKDEQIAQLRADRALLMGAIVLAYPSIAASLTSEEWKRMVSVLQRQRPNASPDVSVFDYIYQMAIRISNEAPEGWIA